MDWHDNSIYAIEFRENSELLIDIDYIIQWVAKGKIFKFWVAPATLIFKNVYDLKLESGGTDLIIMGIIRDNPQQPKNKNYIIEPFEYDWLIETTNGEISFKSVGYEQYLRKDPILSNTQKIGRKD